MSGHSSTGRLKNIDGSALTNADNGNVLVLNLSYDNGVKNQRKRDFFREYFQELGADNVVFVEGETTQVQIGEGFEKAGLLYLPGGDTKTLIHNLRSKGLDARLKSFKGVISGNSGGDDFTGVGVQTFESGQLLPAELYIQSDGGIGVGFGDDRAVGAEEAGDATVGLRAGDAEVEFFAGDASSDRFDEFSDTGAFAGGDGYGVGI